MTLRAHLISSHLIVVTPGVRDIDATGARAVFYAIASTRCLLREFTNRGESIMKHESASETAGCRHRDRPVIAHAFRAPSDDSAYSSENGPLRAGQSRVALLKEPCLLTKNVISSKGAVSLLKNCEDQSKWTG
jgi:hypothetical protein